MHDPLVRQRRNAIAGGEEDVPAVRSGVLCQLSFMFQIDQQREVLQCAFQLLLGTVMRLRRCQAGSSQPVVAVDDSLSIGSF
ncbi:hypothetical protein [Halomonas sp. E19]|uniref:hypothetical protein n=1 Tax=Halomonas sp. E19 TaxID=3397247 RepID=UPI004033341A